MKTRLVTAALVALLAAASAPVLIGHGASPGIAGSQAAGDPRVGDCAPRCPPRFD